MNLLRGNSRMRFSLCAFALTAMFVVSCSSTPATSSSTIPTPARATISTASASGGDGVTTTADLKRTNQGGNVTFEVIWQKDSAPAGDFLQFEVAMDTHSVDLDGIDLTKVAVLRNDGGKEVAPERWDAPAGGHHRSGTIVFSVTIDGGTLIGPQTKFIELVVRGVAGVKERSFKWDL